MDNTDICIAVNPSIMRIKILVLSLSSLVCLAACSPRKIVAKYHYLTDSGSSYRPETSNAGTAASTREMRSDDNVRREESKESRRRDEASAAPAARVNSTTAMSLVIDKADSYLNVPYRYGGISEKGIDCSGLVRNSYAAIGMELPHSSAELSKMGKEVRRSNLKVGDLVFFSARNSGPIDHVGIVTEVKGGTITFIHATTSAGVRYDRLDEGYWDPRFRKARRLS